MGYKIRKSKTIAPGVRVSTTGKSASVSFGGKAGRVTVNSGGKVTKTARIPGTGISYSSASGGHSRGRSAVEGETDEYSASPYSDSVDNLVAALTAQKQQRIENATTEEKAQMEAMQDYMKKHDPKACKLLFFLFVIFTVIIFFVAPPAALVGCVGVIYAAVLWARSSKRCKAIRSALASFYNGKDLPEKW